MKLTTIIFILIYFNCFVLADTYTIKAKAIPENQLIKVKIFIDDPIIVKEETQIKSIKPKYIKRVLAQSNEKIIYNIFTSPYLSPNSVFSFNLKNKQDNASIKLIAIDNDEKITQVKLDINNISNKSIYTEVSTLIENLKISEDISINENIWEIKTIDEAIKELYGNLNFSPSNGLHVKTPLLSENHFSIPIFIRSDLNLESIAILQDSNTYSTVAIITVPSNAIISYRIRFKMKPGFAQNIVIVAKGKNGKIYKVQKTIDVVGS